MPPTWVPSKIWRRTSKSRGRLVLKYTYICVVRLSISLRLSTSLEAVVSFTSWWFSWLLVFLPTTNPLTYPRLTGVAICFSLKESMWLLLEEVVKCSIVRGMMFCQPSNRMWGANWRKWGLCSNTLLNFKNFREHHISHTLVPDLCFVAKDCKRGLARTLVWIPEMLLVTRGNFRPENNSNSINRDKSRNNYACIIVSYYCSIKYYF